MTIQYFPGHMHKARGQIGKMMARVDLVLEVRDARAPHATANPMLADIIGKTPCLQVLNKSDLADPTITQQWLQYFKRQPNTAAISLSALDGRKSAANVRSVLALCRALAPKRVANKMPIRTLVVGIPNIGKSTVINMLSGKRIAKVGDEPGITRTTQQVKVGQDLLIFDTPGVLWPKLEDQHVAMRLAALGTIRDTVFDFQDIAAFVITYLGSTAAYAENIGTRFHIPHTTDTTPEADAPLSPLHILSAIAQRRGCIRPGGDPDTDKAAELLLREFRAGKLGSISLEKPS